jgi:NADH pyrophosphatase NudC (nudix superfamily)
MTERRALILMNGKRILTGIPTQPAHADASDLFSVSGSSAGAFLPGKSCASDYDCIEINTAGSAAAFAGNPDDALAGVKTLYPMFDWDFRDLRETMAGADEAGYGLLSRGAMLLHWHRQTAFCGACGHATVVKSDETAKLCPACSSVFYPRIAPAIIVAIMRGDELLLAHGKHFAAGMYSLLAGFVEAGETLEAAVHREVFEEVGVKVKNIRYLGSQPWAFPDSLMTGFIAEYVSGEIKTDDIEIEDAGWYKLDALPIIPQTVSIAGKIIRGIVQGTIQVK